MPNNKYTRLSRMIDKIEKHLESHGFAEVTVYTTDGVTWNARVFYDGGGHAAVLGLASPEQAVAFLYDDIKDR